MLEKFKISDQRFKVNSDQTIWLIGFYIFTFSILEEGHLPNTFNFIPSQTKFSCKKVSLFHVAHSRFSTTSLHYEEERGPTLLCMYATV